MRFAYAGLGRPADLPRALRERIGSDGVGEIVFCQIWRLSGLRPGRS
jgi:hypothetical protein